MPYKKTFRWKWRHVHADGRVSESKQEYQLFYECMSAARESGYEPVVKILLKSA